MELGFVEGNTEASGRKGEETAQRGDTGVRAADEGSRCRHGGSFRIVGCRPDGKIARSRFGGNRQVAEARSYRDDSDDAEE